MTATKGELWTQASNIIKISDELLKFANANSPNFLSILDTLTQALEGSHTSTTMQNLNSFRSQLASLALNSNILTAVILELAKVGYSSRATSVLAALDDIYQGMIDATETVKNRAWVYGAVSAWGSNVGNGTIYRVIYGKDGLQIESGAYNAGIVKGEIIGDKSTGATNGNEPVSLYGSGQTPTDALELGTCPQGSVSMNATRSEDGKLTNSSFETYISSPISFTGWTLSGVTFAENTSIYYRKAVGLTTGTSIEFTDNGNILQYITDATSRFDFTKPVLLIVRYRRKNSVDGSLTIRLGSKTTAVADLTTKTDATWYDLVIGNANSDGWYDNFKEDSGDKGVRVQITLASRTTGSLLIDNVILAQPTYFDGKWYLVTSGNTDYLKGDYFTFTDSVSNTGRIQTTLARLFGKYLPHTSGSPTYADV